MKTVIRLLAICLFGAVIFAILAPYVSFRLRQREGTNALRGEPIYNGRPLHEWAEETQDQNIDFSPSPNALQAAAALRAVGSDAIPWLVKWIKPPYMDSTLPGGAVESLKILGPQAKPAIPELAKILNQKQMKMEDYTAWSSAAEALSYLGSDSIPIMLEAATNLQGQHIQWELIKDFGNMETNGASAILALIGWTKDKDSWVRGGAIEALGEIGLEPEKVIPVLRKALNDPDDLVRRDAGSALGEFGKKAKDALPDLIKALDDPDYQVQTGAIEGLGLLGEQPDVVLPLLAKKMQNDNWIVRRVTAYALGDIGGQKAFDILMQSTDDPEGFVRETVFQSLKKIDPAQLEKSGKKFYASGRPKPN
jgi:HEAT repeat protein